MGTTDQASRRRVRNNLPARLGRSAVVGAFLIGAFLVAAPTVGATTTPRTIATTSLPAGEVGVAYSAHLRATGGSPAYRYSTSSPLPVGLTLSNDGVLSGRLSGAAPTAIESSPTVAYLDGPSKPLERLRTTPQPEPLGSAPAT